jgi:hypothetical protein
LVANRRLEIWRDILSKPWKWLVAAPFALLGAFQGIRDEFLSPEWQARLKLPHWLPDWSWQTWLLIALAAFLIAVLEGAYRIISIERGSHDDARAADNARLADLESQVKELRPLELSPAQRSILVQELRVPSGTRYTAHISRDLAYADGLRFTGQLSQAFRDAGWAVRNPTSVGPSDLSACGLRVDIANFAAQTAAERMVINALTKAQIKFEAAQRPKFPVVETDVGMMVSAKF